MESLTNLCALPQTDAGILYFFVIQTRGASFQKPSTTASRERRKRDYHDGSHRNSNREYTSSGDYNRPTSW